MEGTRETKRSEICESRHLTARSPFCSADSAKRGEGETLPASCQIRSLRERVSLKACALAIFRRLDTRTEDLAWMVFTGRRDGFFDGFAQDIEAFLQGFALDGERRADFDGLSPGANGGKHQKTFVEAA